MSVITTADEVLDSVREDLGRARRNLLHLIADEPWGWEKLSDEFKGNLFVVAAKIGDVLKLLEG